MSDSEFLLSESPVHKQKSKRRKMRTRRALSRADICLLSDDALLTSEELALYLNCAVSTINKARWAGRGPQYVQMGALIRYRMRDVRSHLTTQIRASTSATSPPTEEALPAA
jgi:hypothetical protein